MVPQVDFDIVSSILRVLDGWELGNKGLYRKYWAYKKIIKISKFYFGPGNPKNDFPDFSGNCFYEKIWISKIATFPEIAISRNRNLVGLVIASETPL